MQLVALKSDDASVDEWGNVTLGISETPDTRRIIPLVGRKNSQLLNTIAQRSHH